jgi:hypothetical protein
VGPGTSRACAGQEGGREVRTLAGLTHSVVSSNNTHACLRRVTAAPAEVGQSSVDWFISLNVRRRMGEVCLTTYIAMEQVALLMGDGMGGVGAHNRMMYGWLSSARMERSALTCIVWRRRRISLFLSCFNARNFPVALCFTSLTRPKPPIPMVCRISSSSREVYLELSLGFSSSIIELRLGCRTGPRICENSPRTAFFASRSSGTTPAGELG